MSDLVDGAVADRTGDDKVGSVDAKAGLVKVGVLVSIGLLEVDKVVEGAERLSVRTSFGAAVGDDSLVEEGSNVALGLVVTLDNLPDNASSKRHNVAEVEGSARIGVGWVQELADYLGVVQRRENGEEDVIVREVNVEGLIEREVQRVLIESAVLGGDRVDVEGAVGESVEELAHVSDTLGFSVGAHDAVVTAELKVEIVLESFPLALGEQSAEVRVSESDRLISAKTLHAVDHLVCQRETRDVLLQTFARGSEVDWVPDGSQVSVTNGDGVRVVASIVGGEGVVESTGSAEAIAALENDLEVDLGWSIPTEESERPVTSRVKDPLLAGGPDDGLVGLSAGIVELAVSVVVLNSRIEELLVADGVEYLGAELVAPVVEERERTGSGKVRVGVVELRDVLDYFSEERSTFSGRRGRVAGSVSVENVDLLDGASLGENGIVFLEVSKDGRGEVGRLVAEVLEEVEVVILASINGLPSSLDRAVLEFTGDTVSDSEERRSTIFHGSSIADVGRERVLGANGGWSRGVGCCSIARHDGGRDSRGYQGLQGEEVSNELHCKWWRGMRTEGGALRPVRNGPLTHFLYTKGTISSISDRTVRGKRSSPVQHQCESISWEENLFV